MSKETMTGTICGCGQRIQFMEYHWAHCAFSPVPAKPVKKEGRS